MIYHSVDEIVHDNVFLNLGNYFERFSLFLKMECFNPAGSIKLKTAKALIDHAEKEYGLKNTKMLIESSSGNLGIALSIICAQRKYQFTCVTDIKTLDINISIMKAYGTKVVVISEPHPVDGYLGARLDYVRSSLKEVPGLVWTDQYNSQENSRIHELNTGNSILDEFQAPDFLYVGTGTAGTLMGCLAAFSKRSPETKIVSVDSVGSVTFGKKSSARAIPGIGASVVPPLFQSDQIDELVEVSEMDAVNECNILCSEYGVLAGGSTGSVLAAIRMMEQKIPPGSIVVAISPDAGNQYIDSIYNKKWVQTHIQKNI